MLTPDEIEACVLGAQLGGSATPIPRWHGAAQDLMAEKSPKPCLNACGLRAGTGQPRPVGLEPEPDRIDMVRTRTAITRGQNDHAELSRRAWPRQPAHDLAIAVGCAVQNTDRAVHRRFAG